MGEFFLHVIEKARAVSPATSIVGARVQILSPRSNLSSLFPFISFVPPFSSHSFNCIPSSSALYSVTPWFKDGYSPRSSNVWGSGSSGKSICFYPSIPTHGVIVFPWLWLEHVLIPQTNHCGWGVWMSCLAEVTCLIPWALGCDSVGRSWGAVYIWTSWYKKRNKEQGLLVEVRWHWMTPNQQISITTPA